ncbi:WW domain-containing protein [Mycena sanguinolenta]|uniref:WW domain-containing protein n=1 Tax=Mycena sanguinolenta TaxID=230812 RepID=A0A8H6YAF2_9AGAR|nr:WW domain-containing protein [Mycena sanguinolenta]
MSNPDTRPLPDGWITQHDPNYDAWPTPPVTTWVHPLGPPPSPRAPAKYSPPQGGPPPENRGYEFHAAQQPGSPYPPQQEGYYNPSYQQSPPGQYNQSLPQYGQPPLQQGYGQPPPGQYSPYNPPPQQYGNPPPQAQGGQGPWSGYYPGQQQQQSMHAGAQPPPQKQGMRLVSRLGGAIMRGAASAAAGAIVREAFSDPDGGSFGGDDGGADADMYN